MDGWGYEMIKAAAYHAKNGKVWFVAETFIRDIGTIDFDFVIYWYFLESAGWKYDYNHAK